jgi:hypothetical protein
MIDCIACIMIMMMYLLYVDKTSHIMITSTNLFKIDTAMASSNYKVRWIVDYCRWWLNDGRRRFEKEENSGKSLGKF